jgi:hypothetical protein
MDSADYERSRSQNRSCSVDKGGCRPAATGVDPVDAPGVRRFNAAVARPTVGAGSDMPAGGSCKQIADTRAGEERVAVVIACAP